MADRIDAEFALVLWAMHNARRDALIMEARAAGVSKHRIFVLTGIARPTIDRVVAKHG